MNGADVPRRADVDERRADGECLLYDAALDRASALNRTATEIWDLCDGARTIAAIAGVLAARYGVEPSAIDDEVADAIRALRTRGLLV